MCTPAPQMSGAGALGHAEGAAQGERVPDAADEAGHHGGRPCSAWGSFAAASPNFCTMVS